MENVESLLREKPIILPRYLFNNYITEALGYNNFHCLCICFYVYVCVLSGFSMRIVVAL